MSDHALNPSFPCREDDLGHFPVVCVTNRHLVTGDFLTQLGNVMHLHPAAVILREKDLDEAAYEKLAQDVLTLGRIHDVPVILHTFTNVAVKLGARAIHLPLPLLRQLTPDEYDAFDVIGTSCHSLADAQEAVKLGADYITAGHIFATKCKDGLPPRGLPFLREMTKNCPLPVYAIGGISAVNLPAVRRMGAAGACVMSGMMRKETYQEYFSK